jgi:ankyrin repeat protein
VDPINEEGRTPLFYATQANNQFAACVLLEQGSNVRQKDVHGRYCRGSNEDGCTPWNPDITHKKMDQNVMQIW